ncbi:Na+/H+ antiporter NhaC [Gallaecimonas pentaromativorans]|uniref:Malate + proton/lactate + sodium antiporter (NhaC family) n=1 Tax=Gallaecimonas pentaromativorans TaxID=584787 RepID=A0A3N1PAY9_9GAMM|nr:Na+/H+ antiporter NhaC [Gallaecimonas pentaromativorans]ROQ25733.1 malate + proton/lactate + sodium antiporter (NhaC family) [Gallaecimonas pentaromativorans]
MTEPSSRRLPNALEISLLALAIIGVIFLFVHVLEMAIQLALLGCWFVMLGFGKYLKLDYGRMQDGITAGINQGMDAILVLIAVGALIGSWMAGGIVPNIIYLGLSVMDPNIFLMAAFFICMITSLATGTSFGTAGTAGVAMMGIGAGFNFPMPLVAGAVISGAYVGDKLSPLSDTTVMTASLCKVGLIDHVKSMLYVAVPAVTLSGLLFLLVGFQYGHGGSVGRATQVMEALAGQYQIAWYMLLPALAVIAMLVMKLPSVPVIFFGAVLGVVWACLFEQMPLVAAIKTLYEGNHIQSSLDFLNILLNRGGIVSMLEVIMLVMLALGLGGLMEVTGVLATISNGLQRWATNQGRLGLSTIFAGFLGNFLGGAAYVSLITATTITAKNYDKLGVDRRVLSRNTEAGGTVTTPMIPWTDGGVFMATTLGVATTAYLPYLWYHFIGLSISIFYCYANIFCFDKKKSKDEAPEAALEAE